MVEILRIRPVLVPILSVTLATILAYDIASAADRRGTRPPVRSCHIRRSPCACWCRSRPADLRM